TVVSTEGLRDVTPDSERSFPWSRVKNIEFSGGDVYFLVPFGDVFVPRSAFADAEAAKVFYESAKQLWKRSNNKLITGQKPLVIAEQQPLLLAEQKPLRLEDYEAEEEKQWKQYEENWKNEETKEKPKEERELPDNVVSIESKKESATDD